MKKTSLLYHFVYGNKVVTICIVFTIATLLDMILCLLNGISDISYWHLANRFLLCVLIVLSLSVYKHFERIPLYAVMLIHFAISLGIMLAWVWITGLYSELHPDAYRDAVRTICIMYGVIISGGIIYDGIRTAWANRILHRL